jgi:hypothetical protein
LPVEKREAPMRSSDSWTLPPPQPAIVKTWCGRLLVFAVSLALFALVAGVATGERSHRGGTSTGYANAHVGAGNLVPVW